MHNIESECISRINKGDVATHLLTADLFFCANFPFKKYMSVMLRKYSAEWRHHTFEVTDLVQLLFFIGHFRNTPQHLMRQIEKSLCDQFHNLLPTELGIICSSFFNCNIRIQNYKLLVNIANKVLEGLECGRMPLLRCTSVMKAFRHADYQDVSFYTAFGDFVHEEALRPKENLNFTSYMTILSSYMSIRIYLPTMFKSVLERMEELSYTERFTRCKDITRLAKACNIFGIEVPQWVIDALIQKLSKLTDQSFHLGELIRGMLVLTHAGVYPSKLLNRALSQGLVNRITGAGELLSTCGLFYMVFS